MLRDPRNLSIVGKIEGGQSSEIGKPVLTKNPATVLRFRDIAPKHCNTAVGSVQSYAMAE